MTARRDDTPPPRSPAARLVPLMLGAACAAAVLPLPVQAQAQAQGRELRDERGAQVALAPARRLGVAGAASPSRPAPPPNSALAQSATGAEIARLKTALRNASIEHPEVQQAQAAADASGFEVEAAKKARYPRLRVGSATGSYNSGAEGARSQNYQLITAEARMSLLDGGAMSARVRAAEAGVNAQDEAVKSTAQKVVLDALTAYLQAQRFEYKRQIAHRSTQLVAELARVEERRIALGAAGENDLRMAGARRASIAAREADFEAQRGEAAAKFETYFKFAPRFAALPQLAAMPAWREGTQVDVLRRAEANSTELAEANGRIERAKALVEQQKASVWPTVDAVVVKSHDPRGVSPQEPTRASLELSWNFGSGFDRQLRVKSALAELQNQEARRDAARLNLTELTSSAWARTVSGRERERQLIEAVNESGQAFRGRRRLMEFGRETLPNVLDAQLDYYTLLLDYVDAVFDLRINEFRLARATGELRIEEEGDTPWLDRVFVAPARPILNEEGLLGALCPAGSSTCTAPPAVTDPAGGAGLALRREGRMPRRL